MDKDAPASSGVGLIGSMGSGFRPRNCETVQYPTDGAWVKPREAESCAGEYRPNIEFTLSYTALIVCPNAAALISIRVRVTAPSRTEPADWRVFTSAGSIPSAYEQAPPAFGATAMDVTLPTTPAVPAFTTTGT